MRAIITADWHLRGDRPRCRLDEDWIFTQSNALADVAELANSRQCPACIIGDLFHYSQVPDRIVSMFLLFTGAVENGVYLIAGNHDLPYHRWENVGSSSFGIIHSSMQVGIGNGLHHLNQLGVSAHFGEEMSGVDTGIMFLHELIFPDARSIPPNTKARTATDLIKDYPEMAWIFTGDYHHNFHTEKRGRHVINPGCLLRQTADLIDYRPGVYYVDTGRGDVEWLEINDPGELVTDAYIQEVKEREDRVSAFVESLHGKGEVSFDFVENIKSKLSEVSLSQGTKEIIHELLEGGN